MVELSQVNIDVINVTAIINLFCVGININISIFLVATFRGFCGSTENLTVMSACYMQVLSM